MACVTPKSERHLIHRGRKFDFEKVTFTNSSGRRVEREVVRHPGAVVILPIIRAAEGDKVVMIRNERFALDRTLWELPAGTREQGEEPARTAARELIEETGHSAGRIESLGAFFTTPGMTDELMHAFVAEDLTVTRQKLEEDERIEPRVVPVDQVLHMLDQGELVDAKSMVTILVALRQGILTDRARARG